MEIIDISLTITPALPIWPGHPAIEISRVRDMAKGDRANVSRVGLSAHSGTHVDAPLHFVPDGRSVELLDLGVLVGPALVAEALNVAVIDAAVLDGLDIPADTTRLLLKTSNSEWWANGEATFREDYVALDTSGARWVLDRGIRLVGIDYLSVAIHKDLVVPHQLLLGAGVIPLEGLNLSRVAPGPYQLICLPLKLGGSDGAPCRAVLVRG